VCTTNPTARSSSFRDVPAPTRSPEPSATVHSAMSEVPSDDRPPSGPRTFDPRDVDRCVTGAAAAHQRLLADLDAATAHAGGFDTGAPSALPEWTRGHVLTHLARNADSLVRLVEAAIGGEVAEQYPGGAAERDAAIEAGARRPSQTIVDDVRRSIWRLETAWAQCTSAGWAGTGSTVRGSVAVADIPFRRWREVEVHHVDLAIGRTFDDWSPEYVRRELRLQEMAWRASRPIGLGTLPARALELPPTHRLAWLIGRVRIEGLDDISWL
jgi:maleylpyruvate isomerase